MADAPIKAWRVVLDRIEGDLLSGALGPGDRLPSVRSFAATMSVSPSTVVEAYDRLVAEGLVRVLDEDPNMFGYCYTQLSDVETERNGIVHYDRAPKLDLERLRMIQERRAAIEQR